MAARARQPRAIAVNVPRISLLAACALVAAGCSRPHAPEWEERTHEALEQYQRNYFDGASAAAERDYGRAGYALASTGRLDLRARGALVRCALAVAALDFGRCEAWEAVKADAATGDQSYGALLDGRFDGLDAKSLPPQYAPLVKAHDTTAREKALRQIEDPVSRLIAAGALFRAGELSPQGVQVAVDTASAQGYRRPLLAWLSAQAKLAEAAGDGEMATRVRRRIELVAPAANSREMER